MALHLLRHPRPDVAAGVCYGRLDLPLAMPDALTGARIEGVPRLDALVSSPARRCRALAEALAMTMGDGGSSLTLTVDPSWQELDFGVWEGRRWDEIDRIDSDPWAEDVWRCAPPSGETYMALTQRVLTALQGLVRTYAPGLAEVAVVTHAGPIRAVHAWVEGLDPRQPPVLPLDFGQIVSVDWHRLSTRPSP